MGHFASYVWGLRLHWRVVWGSGSSSTRENGVLMARMSEKGKNSEEFFFCCCRELVG